MQTSVGLTTEISFRRQPRASVGLAPLHSGTDERGDGNDGAGAHADLGELAVLDDLPLVHEDS